MLKKILAAIGIIREPAALPVMGAMPENSGPSFSEEAIMEKIKELEQKRFDDYKAVKLIKPTDYIEKGFLTANTGYLILMWLALALEGFFAWFLIDTNQKALDRQNTEDWGGLSDQIMMLFSALSIACVLGDFACNCLSVTVPDDAKSANPALNYDPKAVKAKSNFEAIRNFLFGAGTVVGRAVAKLSKNFEDSSIPSWQVYDTKDNKLSYTVEKGLVYDESHSLFGRVGPDGVIHATGLTETLKYIAGSLAFKMLPFILLSQNFVLGAWADEIPVVDTWLNLIVDQAVRIAAITLTSAVIIAGGFTYYHMLSPVAKNKKLLSEIFSAPLQFLKKICTNKSVSYEVFIILLLQLFNRSVQFNYIEQTIGSDILGIDIPQNALYETILSTCVAVLLTRLVRIRDQTWVSKANSIPQEEIDKATPHSVRTYLFAIFRAGSVGFVNYTLMSMMFDDVRITASVSTMLGLLAGVHAATVGRYGARRENAFTHAASSGLLKGYQDRDAAQKALEEGLGKPTATGTQLAPLVPAAYSERELATNAARIIGAIFEQGLNSYDEGRLAAIIAFISNFMGRLARFVPAHLYITDTADQTFGVKLPPMLSYALVGLLAEVTRGDYIFFKGCMEEAFAKFVIKMEMEKARILQQKSPQAESGAGGASVNNDDECAQLIGKSELTRTEHAQILFTALARNSIYDYSAAEQVAAWAKKSVVIFSPEVSQVAAPGLMMASL